MLLSSPEQTNHPSDPFFLIGRHPSIYMATWRAVPSPSSDGRSGTTSHRSPTSLHPRSGHSCGSLDRSSLASIAYHGPWERMSSARTTALPLISWRRWRERRAPPPQKRLELRWKTTRSERRPSSSSSVRREVAVVEVNGRHGSRAHVFELRASVASTCTCPGRTSSESDSWGRPSWPTALRTPSPAVKHGGADQAGAGYPRARRAAGSNAALQSPASDERAGVTPG